MKLIFLCAVLPLALANQCTRNQYWSAELNACLSCSKCTKNQIQTRPCNSHKDTECTTISQTGVEFPWLEKEKENDIFELADDDDAPKKGNKKYKNHHVLKLSNADDDDNDDIYQDFLHSHHDNKNHKKHNKKHHYEFNQRINDKFLRWEDETTTRKPHRNHFLVNPLKNFQSDKHHFSFPSNLDIPSENTKRKNEKRGKTLHDKSSRKRKNRFHNDDEEKLEEWLLMSEQELAKRKEDLLKNIKKDEFEEEKGSNPKIKLNYPLYNTESELFDSSLSKNSIRESTKEKHKSIIDDEENIFKELVKENSDSKLEIETLMSNRKDSQYRPEQNHHMFMDEPSTISEIIGQTKDDQEKMPEENDKVIRYEKSKLSILPMDDNSVEAVPFTAVETFVWDWQAVAFISAVTACLLFFMVVIAYSLINNTGPTAHRRSKNACYTADMEEMSTRIALMQPTLEVNSTDGIMLGKFLPAPTHKS